ncbi:MAG: CoA transferase [Rhodobacteraceae bacterium]|nr:CoA transferase [Paracoccaceae bacterium]
MPNTSVASGPLVGLKVVEFAGLGPTPFAAMLLADMGADVVRIERPNARKLIQQKTDFLNRGRGFVELDLKSPSDRDKAVELIENADALIEGMRPGVMERLGLGPDRFEAANPTLVYGRMTGWGQDGPLAHASGHDINYIALSGALHAIGEPNAPMPPLNLVGDFGGGALYLAFGIVCALLEARSSGRGQVVDAAIVDGTAHLMTMLFSLQNAGMWQDTRNSNLLDGAAPFYTTYQCADGNHMAVGALEPQFYAELLSLLGLEGAGLPPQMSKPGWPRIRAAFAARFAQKTRDEWSEILEGTDSCVAPVLTISEAPNHAHHKARQTFVEVDSTTQPAVAPRLSRTPGGARRGQENAALDVSQILTSWRRD